MIIPIKRAALFTLLLSGILSQAQTISRYQQVIDGINWLSSQEDPNTDSVWGVTKAYMTNAPDTAIGEIYYQFAEFYYEEYEIDSALLLLEESVNHFRIAQDSSDLAAALIYYGHACYDVENIALAIDSYHEALAIYEVLEYPGEVANAHNSIGNAYSYIVDYQSAFKNYEKCLEVYKTIQDSAGVAMVYSNIAGLYTDQKKYDESLAAYEKALAWSQNNIRDQIDNVLGKGVIYQDRKEYKKAEESYKKALGLSSEIRDFIQMAYVYQNLAFLYVATRKLDSAQRYIKLTQQYADQYGIKTLSGNINELKHGYYYAKGEYQLAYDLLKKARNEADSFYGLDMTRQLQEVQAQYSTLKKEKEIAQKDLALEKASSDLQRNRIIRNGLIAGIIAFVFVVIFIYRSQKAKVRANQLLLQKNSEIEEKNKEIKSIEAAKTKWFINIAHELRTPLTLIKGPVRHALLSDPSNDQVHDHLRIADRNVNRLQKLVNEILDISKMESGMMPLNLKNVDLTELVLSAMAAFDDEAMDLGVKLEAVLSLEEPLIGRADGEKINNVIINLISNALKFTHKGGIVTVGLSSENDLIHLYVEDTGEGISQEDIERVFDRFYQASNSAGKQGGTGVGLALCKEIAKMHHGELLVSSELGQGSRFELIIPHVKPFESAMPEAQDKLIPEIIPEISPQPEEAMANESLYKGKCILIVDDNEDMRDYIATFLRNDFELLTAREGAEGLGILKGHTPDLIISDIMMPGMDGLAFAKAVKLSDEWSSIPFITLSAVSDRQEKVRTLRIGIDDYIVKPFDGEELLVRVQNLICNYAERLSLGGEKEEEVSHEQKILKKLEQEVYEHIEDSNFNVQRLAEIASMSERQLYRYIKQMTGLTPASFVREVRLQRAMELLQKGIYKRTSQVSYAVGFQQPAYFSTVFKKRFGRTPSEYIDD